MVRFPSAATQPDDLHKQVEPLSSNTTNHAQDSENRSSHFPRWKDKSMSRKASSEERTLGAVSFGGAGLLSKQPFKALLGDLGSSGAQFQGQFLILRNAL